MRRWTAKRSAARADDSFLVSISIRTSLRNSSTNQPTLLTRADHLVPYIRRFCDAGFRNRAIQIAYCNSERSHLLIEPDGGAEERIVGRPVLRQPSRQIDLGRSPTSAEEVAQNCGDRGKGCLDHNSPHRLHLDRKARTSEVRCRDPDTGGVSTSPMPRRDCQRI